MRYLIYVILVLSLVSFNKGHEGRGDRESKIPDYPDRLDIICPGFIYKNECQRCQCDELKYVKNCTQMENCTSTSSKIPDVLYLTSDYKQGEQCPSLMFEDDCNFCVCDFSGLKADCKQKPECM